MIEPAFFVRVHEIRLLILILILILLLILFLIVTFLLILLCFRCSSSQKSFIPWASSSSH